MVRVTKHTGSLVQGNRLKQFVHTNLGVSILGIRNVQFPDEFKLDVCGPMRTHVSMTQRVDKMGPKCGLGMLENYPKIYI